MGEEENLFSAKIKMQPEEDPEREGAGGKWNNGGEDGVKKKGEFANQRKTGSRELSDEKQMGKRSTTIPILRHLRELGWGSNRSRINEGGKVKGRPLAVEKQGGYQEKDLVWDATRRQQSLCLYQLVQNDPGKQLDDLEMVERGMMQGGRYAE